MMRTRHPLLTPGGGHTVGPAFGSYIYITGSDDLSARGLQVSPLPLWTLAPLTRQARSQVRKRGGSKKKSGPKVGVGHQMGEGAGGGCAPSRASCESF